MTSTRGTRSLEPPLLRVQEVWYIDVCHQWISDFCAPPTLTAIGCAENRNAWPFCLLRRWNGDSGVLPIEEIAHCKLIDGSVRGRHILPMNPTIRRFQDGLSTQCPPIAGVEHTNALERHIRLACARARNWCAIARAARLRGRRRCLGACGR